MKLLVGLGNPGKDYEKTRHNAGFMVIDALKKSSQFIAVKSDKFMNESGSFVQHLISLYSNIPITDLYVIHDDLDIKLGEFKIQFGRGPKDHNGIISVEEKLATKEFWRIRVGVDNRPLDHKPMGIEYVLQNFTDEEVNVLNRVINAISNKLDNI